jgi:hexokinase
MQPINAAMAKARSAFYAAFLRSLLKTKSILATILKFCISPAVVVRHIKHEDVKTSQGSSPVESVAKRKNTVERFLKSVEEELRGDINVEQLFNLSNGMKTQMKKCLQDSEVCMLPSYNHQLPTGNESGTYLALDVGGSTFRVALVRLSGRESPSKIESIRSFKIDQPVKQLKGVLFFAWLAERIEETLSKHPEGHDAGHTLSMGMAWSFPIE